ncbi:uncharacterized protein FIBRA_07733 [Fibroporia radiculosa]|uniref:Uncharacterized protein n=3 Tax=Polyporales TaxID=5303 RepID=J4GVI6_9APHY|nr:uncharacterized protein FIBRA_07733 [Fibroporia radiculosa]CCM05510.1 predicted protein [Fibroporia radiculosa]
MSEIRRKLVIVGDGACGKTCLLIVFSKGTFPEVYVPTVFENYVADVEVDGKHVELALWDTAGQEDYDRLRPLSYPDSHVILICFAVDSPDSLDNVQEKWISEVMHFCAGLPIILVGLKKDLRRDPRTIEELRKTSQRPVTPEEGMAVQQKIGAKHYLECSAKTAIGTRCSGFATGTHLFCVARVNTASKSAMPPYTISARLAQSSPSISVEKGAYRMRAPPVRSPSKLRRGARYRDPAPSSYEKQMAILVVFLISATISCFCAAYYLFTTRWDSRALPFVHGNASDNSSVSLSGPQAVQFDFDPLNSGRAAAPVSMDYDSGEKFMAYLPHSGFHNQRIAFENALVLSRLFNRTLLVPPVRLGNRPLYYLPFDELRDSIENSSKAGFDSCDAMSETVSNTSPECAGDPDFTYVPWEWLVNLTQIKSEQKLLQCWDLTDTWLDDQLDIRSEDTFALKDLSRNQYSFLDFKPSPRPLSRKYLEPLQISSLATRPERLLFLGTLFGSSRLHLRDARNYSLRKRIRQSMAFTNPVLTDIASSIQHALGHQYLSVHVRLGDGLFQANGPANIRLTWWKLLHSVLELSLADTLALERKLFSGESDPADSSLAPPRIPLDIPTLRAPHPRLPPLPMRPAPPLACSGRLHTAPSLQVLNTPLFVATDVGDPRADPLLSRFLRTFPCTFFLSDFPTATSVLDSLESEYDDAKLKPFLMPFLDAMIAARAWQVVGTEQSTFSAFVQDVLWRTYHGFEIVQRG